MLKKIFFLFFSFLLRFYAFPQDVEKAMDYFGSEKYDSAAIEFEKGLPLIEQDYGPYDTSYYTKQINYTAQAFENIQQYEKAEQYFLKIKLIYDTLHSTLNAEYATSLNNLAKCYYYMSNYEAALPLFNEAKSIRKLVFGPKHIDYAGTLFDLAYLYMDMGQYEEALPLFEEASTIYKEILGSNNTQYANTLNGLALLYSTTGNYESAINLFEESLTIYKKVFGANNSLYATSLNNLGDLFYEMGNYDAALPLYTEASVIFKDVQGVEHSDYAMSLGNIANIYSDMGNYKAALPLYEQALSIYKEVLGPKHFDYAIALSNLASLYYSMGNYEDALPLLEEVSNIDKEVLGPQHPSYAIDLSNLAVLQSTVGNYDAALNLQEEALSIRKEILGVNHPDYIRSLHNLAVVYKTMGNFKDALPLLIEASKKYKEILGANHPEYAMSLSNLAMVYKSLGDYEAALPLYEEAINLRKQVLGPFHPEYANSLNNLAKLYLVMDNYLAALPMIVEANIIINRNIQNNFSFMSEEEKKKYLFTVKNNYDVILSFLKNISTTFPRFCINAYNNELLLKGLILTSTTSIQQALLESDDTSLIRQYEQFRILRKKITSEQQKPISERSSDIVAMEHQASDLERNLTHHSQTFSNMQVSFKIKWEDVQKQLKDKEAAIEFVSFQYYDKKITDCTFYCALVLRSNDTLPQMVFLCEELQLKKAIPPTSGTAFKEINFAYTCQSLYNLILKPLDSILTGIKTIYFAPSGLLNSVSMAGINCPDNKTLMEKYDLVQLSSTRTLAMPEEPEAINNAVVYGGIKYDTDTLSMLTRAKKYREKEDELLAYNRSATWNNRSGFRYLEGTKEEAEQITRKLDKKGITTATYIGEDAPEESFVALSGNDSPSVIHISTHGFYYPDTISDENRKKMNLSGSGEVRFRYSDDPLLRSGLLMSGANRAWKGLPIPAGVEDGILTAKEVSNMNLMNTELVVLSACQTGQGDVKGSEGVEGLQRGFKMAGVRYIMMSLWEIPDRETTEFMEVFYDNWLGGQEIRDAFRNTQLKMKNKYRDEPFKWAGFVLME